MEKEILANFQKKLEKELDKAHLYWWDSKDREVLHPIALRPLWVKKRLLNEIWPLGRVFRRALKILPQVLKENDEVARLFALNMRERLWIKNLPKIDPGPVFLRLDTCFPFEGQAEEIKIFEVNGTASAGAYNQTIGAKILKKLLGFEGQLQDVAGMLLDEIFAFAKKNGKAKNFIFIDDLKARVFSQEIGPLARRLAKDFGATTRLSDIRDLRLKNDEFVFREIEFWEWLKIKPKVRLEDLLQSRRVFPGLASDFCFKGFMEFVSSPDFERYFTKREVGLFRRHALWSAVVYPRKFWDFGFKSRQDLYKFALDNQENLVLKPNRGLCGESLKIGSLTAPGPWRAHLERAMGREPGGWVLQEYAPSRFFPDFPIYRNGMERIRAYPTLGIFVFSRGLAFHGRVAPTPIVNVSRGGALAPVFVY